LRALGWTVVLLVIPSLTGCTLAADGASLSQGCPEGTKECDGTCVSTSDDRFGCARASCSPCALHHAVNSCNAEGACVIASCVGSWEDCDRDPDNGCEVDLDTDPKNCGACEDACDMPDNGEAACAEAQCYVRQCEEPFFDCNFDARDGCERNLSTDAKNCGACLVVCENDDECVAGLCQASE
jgi:hypothetical protein